MIWRSGAAAFALCLILLGCAPAKSDRTIVAIPESVAQEMFLSERAGMRVAATREHLDLEWNGPSAVNPQRQIDLLEDAIRGKRFGVIVTPSGGAAIDSAVEDALHRSIPVVVLRDRLRIQDRPHLSEVLEDYAAGAKLVTDRLHALGLRSGNVLLLGVDSYSENSVQRLDALENLLRSKCPGLTIEPPVPAPFGNGFVQMATEHALEKDQHLVAMIALNAHAGLAAVAAMEEGASHRIVPVFVFDPSLPLLLRMRRGEVDSIILQNMRGMGERAVENVVADREGKPYERTATFKPMLLTRENINEQRSQDWLLFNPENP